MNRAGSGLPGLPRSPFFLKWVAGAVAAKAFKVKFRNIAGDEIILDYPPAKA